MIILESTDFKKYVFLAYESDPELVASWHIIAGSSIEDCVDRTVKDLENELLYGGMKFYVIEDNERFVGYFGNQFDGSYMPTIFIMPSYRNRKDEIWNIIQSKMTQIFMAGIFSKNIRCLKFYNKKGHLIGVKDTKDGQVSIFEFRRAS